MISGKLRICAIGALSCVLGLLALSYTIKGTYCLVLGKSRADAVDLHLRWVEERYFLQGQNPYDVWRQHHPRAAILPGSAPITERNDSLDPQLGGTDPTHPPWGYVSGMVLLWPDWPTARWYYAIVNVLALGLIAAWAYAWGRPEGKSAALLAALAVLAVAGNCTALEVGQYGIVVAALLVGALWLDRARREVACGLLVGVAMLKPTIAGPFVLALLIRGRFRAAGAACAYWALSGAVMQAVTGAGPLEVLRQMLSLGSTLAEHGTLGPTDMLLAMGIDRHSATLATMIGVLLPAIGAMLLWPGRSLVPAFAVAALAGRLWTYHKNYDNLALVFLLVPLAILAAKRRPAPTAVIGFLMIGLTLWVPARFTDSTGFQVGQIAMWVIGLALFRCCYAEQPNDLMEPWPSRPVEGVAGNRETSSRIPAMAR